MATLMDSFESTAPRESSGPLVAGRYDFQTNYAILLLIDCTAMMKEYRLVFEWFDDLVLLDCEKSAQTASMFQVKSKDGAPWSLGDLCKKVGNSYPTTITSRLHASFRAMPDHIGYTAFVSNTSFEMKLAAGGKSGGTHFEITADQLHQSELLKLKNALQAEISAPDFDKWVPKLKFLRTVLGIHGQREIVIGHLHRFTIGIDPEAEVRLGPLYDTLHAVLTSRTTYTQQGLPFNILLDRKSIGKSEFDRLIQSALQRTERFERQWTGVASELQAAGVGLIRQIRMKTGALQFRADRTAGMNFARVIMSEFSSWLFINQSTILCAESILDLSNQISAHITSPVHYSVDQCAGIHLTLALEAVDEH